MNPVARLVIGIILLQVVQILFTATVVYFIRRWKHLEPAWSWLRTVGAIVVLILYASALGLIPLLAAFVMSAIALFIPLVVVAAYLVGLKRMTNLDVLGTFFLALGIGLACYVITVVLSFGLDVDLLSIQMPDRGVTGR
jgi:hypothetical protein